MGCIQKALEKGYLEYPGLHVGPTICLTVCPFWIVPVLLAASFCQQAASMSAYKVMPRVVASPKAPQKPLVWKGHSLVLQTRCGLLMRNPLAKQKGLVQPVS